MSDFEVKVQPIFIKEHPGADLLELGNIGSPEGWQVVVGKGLYQSGDLIAYIGENSVVPDWVLQKYGYWDDTKDKGKLVGTRGDRVKACRLRGEFSLGIVIPIKATSLGYSDEDKVVNVAFELEGKCVQEDDDVAELLGVTKYTAPVPVCMAGEVCNLAGKTLSYDIENIKNYPDEFEDGELVEFTEKLHGTWFSAGQYPSLDHEELYEGNIVVSSKGLSGQGLAFKFNENNKDNLYVNAFKNNFINKDGDNLFTKTRTVMLEYNILTLPTVDITPIYFLGEIFGQGVQDLTYGLKKPEVRIFDIYVGNPGTGFYLSVLDRDSVISAIGLTCVPKLYTGPFDKVVLAEYTNGIETISGTHIREGVVIKPIIERRSFKLGRVVLKSVSAAYLLRKNKNATEYN